MDHISGKRCTGPFVALGADIGVAPNGIHCRVVLVNPGDGLTQVALHAGDITSSAMEAVALCLVTAYATSTHSEIRDPSMGISLETAALNAAFIRTEPPDCIAIFITLEILSIGTRQRVLVAKITGA